MSEEKTPNVVKQIHKNYRKHFAEKSGLASLLAIFVVICLVIGFFVPLTLLITVPVFVLPFLFTFIIANLSVNQGGKENTKLFFKISLYYNEHFFGTFNVWGAVLKTILTYLISTTIFSLIFHLTMGLSDPTYMEILNNLVNAQNVEELTRYMQDLQGNQVFKNITNLTYLISFGLASYMFVHHVLTHSFKCFYNLNDNRLLPMRLLRQVHRRAFPKFRRFFYMTYYLLFSYIILLFVGGYIGGAFIGVLLLNLEAPQAGIIGLLLSLIATIYLLPLIFDHYYLLSQVCSFYYYEAFLDLISDDESNNVLNLSAEDRKELSKMVTEIKAVIEKTTKPEKDADEKKTDKSE